MTNQTIKYLTNLITLLGNEHKQIRRVMFEFEDQLNNFSTSEEDFPILFISPTSNVSTSTWRRGITLKLQVYDLITRGRENVPYLISDTTEILNDFIMYFNDENFSTQIELSNTPVIRPINNALLDRAVGSEVELEFDTSTVSYCDIPFINGIPTITDTSIVTPGRLKLIKDITTNYTLSVGDNNNLLVIDSPSNITITIPDDSISLYIGTQIELVRYNIGEVEIVGDTGVIVNSTPGNRILNTYSTVYLTKVKSNEWLLSGDLKV